MNHLPVIHRLLDGAVDARTLARLAIPMTESDFLNLCEERALAGRCGNPLCSNQHKYSFATGTPKIDWSTLSMVTVAVDQHWCSKECHIKCAQFARSLGSAIDRLEVLQKLSISKRTRFSHAMHSPLLAHPCLPTLCPTALGACLRCQSQAVAVLQRLQLRHAS
jgi:hypothetical protein